MTRTNKWIWTLLVALLLFAVTIWLFDAGPLSKIQLTPPSPPPSPEPYVKIEDVLTEAVKAVITNGGENFSSFCVVERRRGVPDKVFQQLQEQGIRVEAPEPGRLGVIRIRGYWQATGDLWIVILTKGGLDNLGDTVAVIVQRNVFDREEPLRARCVAGACDDIISPPEVHLFLDQ